MNKISGKEATGHAGAPSQSGGGVPPTDLLRRNPSELTRANKLSQAKSEHYEHSTCARGTVADFFCGFYRHFPWISAQRIPLALPPCPTLSRFLHIPSGCLAISFCEMQSSLEVGDVVSSVPQPPSFMALTYSGKSRLSLELDASSEPTTRTHRPDPTDSISNVFGVMPPTRNNCINFRKILFIHRFSISSWPKTV